MIHCHVLCLYGIVEMGAGLCLTTKSMMFLVNLSSRPCGDDDIIDRMVLQGIPDVI